MALADVILPADDQMPAASEADADGAWLDRVLSVRADLGSTLTRVLEASTGRDPVAEVRRLRTEDPEGFLALATAVAGAYYLNPRIRALHGYPGQMPSLPEPGESNHDLRDGLLEPVVARGPIYRPTPA
jgi:hypothetical protein